MFMRSRQTTIRFTALAFALTFLIPAGDLRAGDASWSIEQPLVRVACTMTVGGSFEAKTTSVAGTLAEGTKPADPYNGEIAVDLRTLDAGIGVRTEHMRSTYLEVGKGDGYDKATLSQITVSGLDGRVNFGGTLHLHGTSKPISGQAEIRRTPGAVRVDATFPVSLTAFDIAEPRYLGVGVKDVVQVRVTFVAKPS
jgi:polyisoprenoid-binding protein YceI